MEISTVGQCVLELILNSVDAKTTGVAVRFHNEEKRIQVVDNGEGIPPDILSRIGETEKKNGTDPQILTYCPYSRGKTLKSILELCQICIITSRCERSTETYEKVYKAGETPIFLQGNRPAKGTSITICGFQGSGWESASDAIRFSIASVALIYTNVSFTLHNQITGELVTGIRKPHEPYDILTSICEQTLSLKTTWHLNRAKASRFKISGYVGYLKPNSIAVRHIFINRRPTMCLQIQNLILKTMDNLRNELKISPSEEIYFLIYIECPYSDYILSSYASRTFVVFQNWEKVLDRIKIGILNTVSMDYDMKAETKTLQPEKKEIHRKSEKGYKLNQEELSLLSQMDTDQRTLEAKNEQKIHEKKNQNVDHKESPKDLAKTFESPFCADNFSQLSEWSDWNYEKPVSKGVVQPTETKKSTNHRLYVFLPPVLNPMLRFGKTNIISEANIRNSDNICSAAFNPEIKHDNIVSRYQNLNVRPCVVVSHSNEFKLNRKSLYSIQILNQINLEFIAALTNQDGKRLLLMIDQHAADERIRYEDLLESYRINGTKQYFSVELQIPILINELEPQKCDLLLSNETLLRKFGIRLKSESVGSLKVLNIPRCFLKKRSFDSDFKMACSVRNLLLEIIESLDSTNSASILPRSIHNAIASEACRGAVKFGDPLTIDQCNLLIQALRETNAPNRCAHGRPSVIPLLDITDLKKKQTKIFQGKLNFASLKNSIKNK
ncbi:DNA mismatch repair protein Mlh3-like [Belonocnema kinseyi]|uniref:DNA mismatch repair protein Mlh3-like n=1 Tax=Belonocnema kinseyi TaxID=2817044 RepID=UPI00143D1915|nr:DNA mismatch repair protein Mlh3-like [Belonocnema kinseyi]